VSGALIISRYVTDRAAPASYRALRAPTEFGG